MSVLPPPPAASLPVIPSSAPLASSPNAMVNLGPPFVFDDYVPKVDFEQVAKLAMDSHGSRIFWAGGLAVTLGFFIRILIALWAKEKGKPFDYKTPTLFAVFWLIVGAGYAVGSAWIITAITSIGLLENSGDALTEVFARRYAGFMAHQEIHDTSWVPQMLTAVGWKVASLELLVHISYVLVLAAVLILKAGQVFVLQSIIVFGPILLGLASIGPFFHVLAVSWFWALFEVSMWSVSIGVVLHGLDTFTRLLPHQFSWISEVLVSFLTLAMIVGVTKYTSMVVRGDSAGSLGRDFAQTAYGAARLTQGAQKAVGKVMGPMGGKAAGDLGMSLATKGMATFGGFMGKTLRQSGMQMNPYHAPSGGAAPSASATGGGSDAAASAQRKQQNKHFAVKAKMKRRGD